MAFTVRKMEDLLFCFHEEINEIHAELSSEVKEKSTIKSKCGFIKRVDKGWITTVEDLESWRFEFSSERR